MKRTLFILLLTFVSSLFTFCRAQYRVLLNFNVTNGSQPTGSLITSGNVLYGLAQYGGVKGYGCIFKIATDGSRYKDLFDFNDTDGFQPLGSLTLIGKMLYGMVVENRVGRGDIFTIDTNGNGFRVLFYFNGADGDGPLGSLTLSGKKLYGTTNTGGASGVFGNVFSIDTNGSGFKVLLNFNGANGGYPNGDVILLGKRLYGIAPYGGGHDSGLIFSIDTSGKGYKDIFDFNSVAGGEPEGTLALSNGKLYGMTTQGGSHGNIFSIDTDGSGFKDMLDFNGTDGSLPLGSLILSGHKLYGMTSEGGTYDKGTIFSIDTNGTEFKDLFYFNGVNGSEPQRSNLLLSGNVLYGMTINGGINDQGVIFSFDTTGDAGTNNLSVASNSINIHPNPSNGIFQLEIGNYQLGINNTIEIYNIIGEKVYAAILKQFQGNNNIDISNQPNGVYLYRVLANNKNLIDEGKMIIQK